MKPARTAQGKSGPTGPAPDRVRAMFGAIAPTYDLLNHTLSLSVDRTWRTATVNRCLAAIGNPADGPRLEILDVATGTGDLALAFSGRLGNRARITGVDFVGQMLRHAVAKSTSSGRSVMTFAEGDGHQLPFRGNQFDIATIAFGLRNTQDPDQVVRELTRVVRPGGAVAILDFFEQPDSIFRKLFTFYFHHILPHIGNLVSRSDAYRYLPDSVKVFWNFPRTRSSMKRAGLRDVKSWSLSGGIAGLHVGVKAADLPEE